MKKFKILQNKTLKIISVIALALLCLIILLSIIFTIKYLHEEGELEPDYIFDEHQSGDSHHKVKVDDIEEWMTFDYINVVFNIEPNYFKKILMIEDSKYPNIRIDSYAKSINIQPDSLLQQVKQNIVDYHNIR
jgi:hypothetical protein